jgi:hypothetical protein
MIPTVRLEEDLVNMFVYHGVRGPRRGNESEQVF